MNHGERMLKLRRVLTEERRIEGTDTLDDWPGRCGNPRACASALDSAVIRRERHHHGTALAGSSAKGYLGDQRIWAFQQHFGGARLDTFHEMTTWLERAAVRVATGRRPCFKLYILSTNERCKETSNSVSKVVTLSRHVYCAVMVA